MISTHLISARTALPVAAALALVSACDDGSHAPAPRAATTAGASSASTSSGTSAGTLPVTIARPNDGDRIAIGRPLDLAGSAVGSSGAAVASGSLVWSSSLDGRLGTGSTLSVPAPTPGIHQVQLEATDPQGRVGRASVRVVVAGAGGRSGRDLANYLLGLPNHILGAPIQIPPDFHAMTSTNPTDINAATGAGRMAAGISESGAVTVLRWPSPSYYDQVNYLARPGRRPGFGALENMGVFAGVVVDVGGQPTVSWLRDPTWRTRQSYLDDAADVVVTEHTSTTLGLRVTETAFVRPDRDVLALHHEVERLAGGPRRARLLLHENLAPCTWKVPYLPVSDWLLDAANDFAAAYSTRDDAVVHFRPEHPDWAALTGFALSPGASAPPAVDRWIDRADATFGRGSYLALGSVQASDAVQVGPDMGGNAGGPGALDAYADAQDGALGGNPFAAVRANAALARDLDLASGSAEATFYVAAGPSLDGPDGARTVLEQTRRVPYAQHLANSLSDWRAWVGRARLPRSQDPHVQRLSKRGLVSIRTATDAQTGAIVASIATQLPYGLDWPRDGAFINRALDEAGYTRMVTKHNLFYARVQRRGPVLPGTYDMNYYADGTPGGPIPFEIDNAGLAVWTMVDHLQFIQDPTRRAAYLQQVYPAIRRGADFLAGWRDPQTGLQAPANEDDNIQLTQGIQGAETVVLALDAAIQAGRAAGESAAVLTGWRQRRDELRRALLRHFWDAGRGRLIHNGSPKPGMAAWAIWPCPVLRPGDPRRAQQGDHLWAELQHTFSGGRSRSGYDFKSTLALSHLWANDPRKADLQDLMRRLARDMPTPGTDHLAEFYFIRQGSGGVTFEQDNNVPHVWEHALFYLTARRLF